MNEQTTVVQGYSQKQTKALTTAMLVASIGFMVTCALGWGLSFLWEHLDPFNFEPVYYQLIAISSVSLIATMILSIVWSFKWDKWSVGAGVGVISLYCLAESIGFSSLFVILEVKALLSIFGLVGFMLLGTYGISKVVSAKGILTLTKLIFFLFGFYIIGSLLLFMTGFFVNSGFNTLWILMSFVGGLLSVFYLIYEFWMLQRMDEFFTDSEIKTKLAVFFGFQILIDLVSLVWQLARIFLLTNRN